MTKAYIWRNRGEIAEGWYDPLMREKALEFSSSTKATGLGAGQPSHERGDQASVEVGEDLASDVEVGPSLPPEQGGGKAYSMRSGPAIPSLQDLELKRGKHRIKILN